MRRDEENDVSSYRMTFRKTEDTGVLNRKHQSTLCTLYSLKLALEEAMDLS
jgi:hypothetical protein